MARGIARGADHRDHRDHPVVAADQDLGLADEANSPRRIEIEIERGPQLGLRRGTAEADPGRRACGDMTELAAPALERAEIDGARRFADHADGELTARC